MKARNIRRLSVGFVHEARRVQPVEFRSQVSPVRQWRRVLAVQFRDQPRLGDLVELSETLPAEDRDGCVSVPLQIVARREVVESLLGEAEPPRYAPGCLPAAGAVVGD